jgi:hypothetical protein
LLLSGLFWRGAPRALLEQVREGVLTPISSPSLPAKLAEVVFVARLLASRRPLAGSWLQNPLRQHLRL